MFPRWAAGVAVLAAWGGAMAWRVDREVLPLLREAAKPSYKSFLQGKLPFRESFRVGFRGKDIGRLFRDARRLDDGSIVLGETLNLSPGPLLESLPLLRMAGLDLGDEPLRVQSNTFLSPDYRLTGFDLKGRLGTIPVKANGDMQKEGMRVLLDFGGASGMTHKALIPADPERPLLLGVSGLGSLPGLSPGGRWESSFLNPLTGKTETLRAEYAGEETITMGGEKVRARKVLVHHGMGEARVWTDREGRLLRQEVLGLVLEREGGP